MAAPAFESVLTEEEIRALADEHFPKPSEWWINTWQVFLVANPDVFAPLARAVEALTRERLAERLDNEANGVNSGCIGRAAAIVRGKP